jgi:RND superfamily putative drug exporter
MHLTGPANWAIPGWLDRILPRLAVEAKDEASATGPEAGLDPAKSPLRPRR